MTKITFEEIKKSEEIKTYIKQADASMETMGYTEHSFTHATLCAEVAGNLLNDLGYNEHDVELARIAAFMHDIGNLINRVDHAQSGALMAFRILDKMGMNPQDMAVIVTAIGNHDESTAYPVNAIAAAIIIADKTDVRRSRVRNRETIYFDIHDRVNYAVEKSRVQLNLEDRTLTLLLTIDTEMCSVAEYFEIFLGRMLLCRKAAEALKLTFKLCINGNTML